METHMSLRVSLRHHRHMGLREYYDSNDILRPGRIRDSAPWHELYRLAKRTRTRIKVVALELGLRDSVAIDGTMSLRRPEMMKELGLEEWAVTHVLEGRPEASCKLSGLGL
ncbi:hypothetical protein ACFX2G_041216 [Malus domestica]